VIALQVCGEVLHIIDEGFVHPVDTSIILRVRYNAAFLDALNFRDLFITRSTRYYLEKVAQGLPMICCQQTQMQNNQHVMAIVNRFSYLRFGTFKFQLVLLCHITFVTSKRWLCV